VPMGQPEDLNAIKQGFPRLAFTYEAGADLIFNVDMTRRAWGEKNQEPLVRTVRGLAASYEFMNDPKNRAEVTSIVKESLKVSDEIARQLFAPYTEPDKNVLPKRGELDLKAFDRVLKLMGEVGVISTPVPPADRFVDLRYEAGADLIFNVDMTRRAWGEKNQEPLVRMVRGLAAAYEFMNDPKNRAEVTSMVKESLKVSDEIARQLFAPYTEPDKNVLPKRGELDLKAFDRVLKLMGEVGAIPTPVAPAERFVDLRYLKAAGIQ